jgi:hypothetical protein
VFLNWISYILDRNCSLKHAIEKQIEGKIEVTGRTEEDVSSCWMILRKRQDPGNWKRKHWIALCLENSLWERP